VKITAVLRVGIATVIATGLALGSSGVVRVAAADYSRYHTYDELTAALRELAKTHANLARLVEVVEAHDADDRLPRARHGHHDCHLRQREGRKGDGDGGRQVGR
jgi:HEPN domain-containing protein